MNIFFKNPLISHIGLPNITCSNTKKYSMPKLRQRPSTLHRRGRKKMVLFLIVKDLSFVSKNFLTTKIAIYINLLYFLTPAFWTKNYSFFSAQVGYKWWGLVWENPLLLLMSCASHSGCGDPIWPESPIVFCSLMQKT